MAKARKPWREIKTLVVNLSKWQITEQTQGHLNLVRDNKTGLLEVEFCKARASGGQFGFRYYPFESFPNVVLAYIEAYKVLRSQYGTFAPLEVALR